jgi:hypothetical protein
MKSSRMRAKTDNAKTATKLLVALTGKASPAKAAEGDHDAGLLMLDIPGGAVDRDAHPGPQAGSGVAATDDCGDAVLARDDRGM